MSAEPDYAEFLYQALDRPLGLVLRTENPERLRQKLYKIRKQDPRLEVLHFVISATDDKELWVIKREPNVGS